MKRALKSLSIIFFCAAFPWWAGAATVADDGEVGRLTAICPQPDPTQINSGLDRLFMDIRPIDLPAF